MSLNDPIADALSKINNAVKALNRDVTVKRSKFMLAVLEVMKANNYVGSFGIMEESPHEIKINLLGTINKCLAIKPRYPVKIEDLEKEEKRFLPAKDFGVLIISTNKGLLTQKEAKEQNVGGTLVAYCY